jgi:predicted nucleotide-binding protein (sugar kinase/HSP70/actin superfamily)
LLSHQLTVGWQHRAERRLLAAVHLRPEPSIEEILEAARPYLPSDGAMGEMVVNVGRAICLAKRGADGIIDISPWGCMNGIVAEAIYPRVSRDCGGIPIRSFYFDGLQDTLDMDLPVFMELVKAYRKRRRA